jgi:hypothetical protein
MSSRGARGVVLGWLAFACMLACAQHASAAPPKRAVPDYDGRGEEPLRAADVLLAVPRILLAPAYVATEYLIRRPLGFLIASAEQARVAEVLYGLFTFGPDHKTGLVPIAFLDFGLDPSVGLYFFSDDAFARGNQLRVRASTWGLDWLAADVTDRMHFRRDDTLAFHVTGVRRPDLLFAGIGPRSLDADLGRYGADRFDAGALAEFGLGGINRLALGGGVRAMSFRDGEYREDASIEERADAGVYPLPPGYERGYTAFYNSLRIALDSRRKRPAPGSGVRLETGVEQGSDLRASPGAAWLRYGASAGAFYDLDDHGRVISLALHGIFADPLNDRAVPFTELATLGGSAPLRGFLPGRLVGRSALAATVRYRWPIWIWLDGSLQVAVGNVFGPHFEDFAPGLLRFSSAIGVESIGSPDSSLELLFGLGSETFAHGGQITSLRFVVGTNHGF